MAANPAPRIDFRRIMQNELQLFLTASREFGLPLTALADMVQHAFEFEQAFIERGLTTLHSQRGRLANLLDDLSRSLREIQEFRDRNRHVQEFFNHLAAVAESVVALSWVTLERNPVQFIRDMKEAGDYFGNRVLSANRGNPQHLNWWNKWTAVMIALENYVRTHHLTGFTYAVQAVPPGPPGPPAPPGPPGPPPPPPMEPSAVGPAGDATSQAGVNRNALLNQINQGVGIVGMLRPVRPAGGPVQPAVGPRVPGRGGDPFALPQPQAPVAAPAVPRPQAPVAAPAVPRPQAPVAAPAVPRPQAPVAAPVVPRPQAPVAALPPPKFVLEGRKWRVENYRNATGLTVIANEMSETLAMFRSENSELEVANKINGATIDNCRRCTVVFRDVISTVELIRCQHMTIQCIGHVPSITLDNCDSIQLFLTKASHDTEIVTSKTSSLNVCLLSVDGDYVELPVPEQIKTTVVNGSLQSSVVQQI